MTYEERASIVSNPTAKRLLLTIAEKQSNLALAADAVNAKSLLALVRAVGDDICLLKTHVDIITDFSSELIHELQTLAQQHRFLLFEDRKFADIGNTVKLQYKEGIYHIVEWADIVNAHVVPGPGIIEGLRDVGLPKGRGLLLLAEMSSKGNLAIGSYTQHAIRFAKEYSDFVIGFIAMKRLIDDPRFITMTPGVHITRQGDIVQQQYITPEQAISGGSDVVIVGRGIYDASESASVARQYRTQAWKAYQQIERA